MDTHGSLVIRTFVFKVSDTGVTELRVSSENAFKGCSLAVSIYWGPLVGGNYYILRPRVWGT